jgi:alkylation response protein AidB-like acyl-CoA dehydrogenase
MDMTETAADAEFRAEIRSFLARNLPDDIRDAVRASREVGKDALQRWQRILYDKGWGAPAWPVEWGGTGWSLMQRHIFDEECALAFCPPLHVFNFGMLGPILIRYGSEAQKKKYLPRILRSEDWWCQGYSEPGAGSDLAALKTRAERDGDHYVVTGTKIWTSLAHWANRMFCLVRTDPAAKPQAGISFLLIDMDSPGIAVRPIISISGQHVFNQVFLDAVRVPVGNLVHRENEGWTVAKSLLEHERLGLARVGENKKRLQRLKEIAAQEASGDLPLIAQDWFRRKLVDLEVRLRALEVTCLRFVAQAESGRELGPGVSMLKLRGSKLLQDILQTTVDALAYHGLPFDMPDVEAPESNLPELGPDHAQGVSSARFQSRAYTIAGGSSEVQRGIMAKHVLRLNEGGR